MLALARLSPPLLRNAFALPLPPYTTATVAVTLYEAAKSSDDPDTPVPAAAVLAEVRSSYPSYTSNTYYLASNITVMS